MKWKIFLWCFFFSLLPGCSYLQDGEELRFQLPIIVFKDRYIIEKPELRSAGIFCEWHPGQNKCNALIADVEYEVKSGNWTNAALVQINKVGIRARADEKIPYKRSEDECLTNPMFKGVACSPDYEVSIDAKTNDPLLEDQWGYFAVRAGRGGSLVGGLPGPVVAVLDTGVNADHEDLSGQVVSCYDAVSDTVGACSDPNTHGTFCGGIIAAKRNNALGISGICPNCKLMGIRFLGSNGSGSLYHAIRGLDYAVQNGARIINASFGGGGYSAPFREAIKRANAKGVLIVAAAGNEANNSDVYPSYPASYDEPNVLSIAATNEKKSLAQFSNFGKESVDLAAPGTNILSTRNDGGYGISSGTSFSAPAVAGIAGLILTKEPTADNERVKERIFSGIKRIKRLKGKMRYNGIANAYRSLK